MNKPTYGSLVLAGGVFGVLSGVVSFIIWLVASWIGMPTEVNIPGQGMVPLQWFQFIGFSTMMGLAAGVVAGLLRNAASGVRIFTTISVVVLVVSFIGPFINQADTAMFTKIILLLTHVVVFAAVVPALTQRMRGAAT